MASVPTLRRRSELNYKTLHEGDPLPVPQQKRNINVVLPETYIVERLVWRKKNDQVSMIINLLLRFQGYQQTTLVDKHLTKPTHQNFTAKLKKCVNIFHADCFLKILFWKYSFKIVYKFQTIWTMIRLDDSRDLSWVQIYQQTTLENKVLIERPRTAWGTIIIKGHKTIKDYRWPNEEKHMLNLFINELGLAPVLISPPLMAYYDCKFISMFQTVACLQWTIPSGILLYT